jgi:hypothetical protein
VSATSAQACPAPSRAGMPLPPWRSRRALLSLWLPVAHADARVVAQPGAEALAWLAPVSSDCASAAATAVTPATKLGAAPAPAFAPQRVVVGFRMPAAPEAALHTVPVAFQPSASGAVAVGAAPPMGANSLLPPLVLPAPLALPLAPAIKGAAGAAPPRQLRDARTRPVRRGRSRSPPAHAVSTAARSFSAGGRTSHALRARPVRVSSPSAGRAAVGSPRCPSLAGTAGLSASAILSPAKRTNCTLGSVATLQSRLVRSSTASVRLAPAGARKPGTVPSALAGPIRSVPPSAEAALPAPSVGGLPAAQVAPAAAARKPGAAATPSAVQPPTPSKLASIGSLELFARLGFWVLGSGAGGHLTAGPEGAGAAVACPPGAGAQVQSPRLAVPPELARVAAELPRAVKVRVW